jgi:diaminohydroxyphosphoribosylaminopyrimidine deaminase / 5-amino-6-(5-phosphoribosylamino)uracil reductase
MSTHEIDAWHMARALELAARGQGFVEPNPTVGCVIARGAEIIGEGWHRRFGGPHAEVEALQVAGARARGCTMYVTLEPCCHYGKTPPCTDAVLASGVNRVVIALADPFPDVAGGGIALLRAAGLEVVVGVREEEVRRLNAPYLKLLATGRPWVIAKWAMTLDGKLATRSGDSRWISGEASRQIVHALRGRVDAVIVGRGTAQCDDPLLTARPAGPRLATRIVLDRRAELSSESKLVQTASESPVLVVADHEASAANCRRLRDAHCEVLMLTGATREDQLCQLLDELGRRRMTNVLVEGGAAVFGALFDAELVDEVLAFIAPKIVGGRESKTPVAGKRRELMAQALSLADVRWQQVGEDLLVRGRVRANTG